MKTKPIIFLTISAISGYFVFRQLNLLKPKPKAVIKLGPFFLTTLSNEFIDEVIHRIQTETKTTLTKEGIKIIPPYIPIKTKLGTIDVKIPTQIIKYKDIKKTITDKQKRQVSREITKAIRNIQKIPLADNKVQLYIPQITIALY